jgi:sodium transport system permease protein
MRWSIVRLIWVRELRDQLRDRRTVFMIVVLPVVLYPLAGLGFLQLRGAQATRPALVGVAGLENVHPWRLASTPRTVARAGGAFLISPGPVSTPLTALPAFELIPPPDYRPLFAEDDGTVSFAPNYVEVSSSALKPQRLTVPEGATFPEGIDRTPLDERRLDAILAFTPGFQERLEAGEQPRVYLFTRARDDSSQQTAVRVAATVARWKRDLKRVRFTRQGLPADFDDAIVVVRPDEAPPGRAAAENAVRLLVRIFPFILVMWSLAGALYPAVDVCAGEKERGTMETLLISPASREEIVWGKFLTIWVFSAATALLNLGSMLFVVTQAASALPGVSLKPVAVVWAVLLLLPLSAFFSALCLAVGAYARSSKEGQYYLMPLFLVTMPLIFLTLAPGVELNPFYSMVPVTGVALLLQRLMLGDGGVWLYFVPVLAPMVIYSWLALRWAIAQFQSEEVLFREAERLDLGLWLARLFREKEALPTAGEAIFCFAMILVLRWVSFSVGTHLPLWARTGVAQIAFVATPALFMALLLTTRPKQGLALRVPPWWSLPVAALLAAALLAPLAELTLAILSQFPGLRALLEMNHPLTRELRVAMGGQSVSGVQLFIVLAVLPALCEEIAFRGFILSGLRRGFRPWPAVLLSSFLFSLYQMNVFQFVPHFLLGIVLGLLVVRTGSLWPAVVFHFTYNSLLMLPVLMPDVSESVGDVSRLRAVFSVVGLPVAAALLWLVWALGKQPEAVA